MNVIKAGLAYFAAVFAAGCVLGTVRVLVIIPLVGEAGAVLAELPSMLAISWLSCGWLLDRFSVPGYWSARLTMGTLAFCLLMTAELGLAVFFFGSSVAGHLQRYRTMGAALGLVGQVAFAAFPLVRLKRGKST